MDFAEKRRKMLDTAKREVSAAYSGEEHSLIQAVSSLNEIEKVRNSVFERLEEWYSMYFPELKLANPATYATFVVEFGADKLGVNPERLNEIMGEKAEEILNIVKNSIGRNPSSEEYEVVKNLAQSELEVIKLEKNLDAYVEKVAKKLMPNITYLIDHRIAAELLAKAGSLEKMSMMPASTIQLLGAERALFKHLKYGSKSPKYGVLFKLQRIATAIKEDRGRIARVYATKIAIAAKADYITKRFIADKLKEQIDEALKRPHIHKEQPNVQQNRRNDNQFRRFDRFSDKNRDNRGQFNRDNRFSRPSRDFRPREESRPQREGDRQSFRPNRFNSEKRDNFRSSNRNFENRNESRPQREGDRQSFGPNRFNSEKRDNFRNSKDAPRKKRFNKKGSSKKW